MFIRKNGTMLFKINYKIILEYRHTVANKYSEPAKHSKEKNTHRFK